ncbi:MAG: DUF6531 domain-containing protein [Phototrophicaceae bacterium]
MKRLRWYLGLLLIVGGLMPVVAQDSTERTLAYGDLVSAIFVTPDDMAHQWGFDAAEQDIITVQVRRIAGIFTPRITLIAPDGTIVPPSLDNADDHLQTVTFRDGIVAGRYQINVSQENAQTNGSITQNEYTLALQQRGQQFDLEAALVDVPRISPNPFPDYFLGRGDSETFDNLTLFGDVTITQIDNTVQASRFLISGARDLTIDNTNTISRLIDQIAIRDDGIALQTVTGAIVFTDTSISNLNLENSLITLTLTSGISISTDFYNIATIVVLDNLTEIQLLDGQRLLLDGDTIRVTRRGGINGEGPNVEPVLLLDVDEFSLSTDMIGWQTLTLLDDNLQVIYDAGWQFQSDEPSGRYFQADATHFDLQTIYNDDQLIDLAIDSTGLSIVAIQSGAVAVTFNDARRYVDELLNLEGVTIDQQALQFDKTDHTVRTILPDETRMISPMSIEAPTYRNFNNLGTTVTDYHPHVDMDFALNPVNRINGNFNYTVQDYIVPSSALALDWSRTYNSMASNNQSPEYMRNHATYGHFGNQWRHSYQIELDVQSAPLGVVELILADGSRHRFTQNASNPTQFRSQSLRSWTLHHSDSLIGDWTAYQADGQQLTFDAAGRLQGISNALGQALLFSEMPPSYAQAMDAAGGFFITESYGRRLAVYTDTDFRIIAVQGVQGRVLRYDYDTDNQLINVDYLGADYQATYEYQAGLLVRLDDVNSPIAQSLSIAYNDSGQVTGFTDYPNAEQSQHYSLSYNNNRTTQTWQIQGLDDAIVTREMIWTYDDNYRLSTWVMPDSDWVYQWRYVQDTGILSEIVQPTRAILRFTYDTFGYLTRFTDPLFGESGSYNFTYSGDPTIGKRVLTQVDAPSITAWMTYDYDDQTRLIATNQALSGAGANRQYLTTSYTYDARNQLRQMIETGASGALQITDYAYDDYGYPRLIRLGTEEQITLNEPLKRWQLRYDGIGRLLASIDETDTLTSLQWSADRGLIESIMVGEVVYRYQYDNADNLIAYETPVITENYQYDANHRMISRTDRLGRMTSYQYDSFGNLIRQILPNERTITYQYDVLDNLIAVTDADDITTQYSVRLDQDANRIIHTTSNALNEQMQVSYDPLGRIRQVIDLDRNGALTFRYSLTYDALGNVTEILDSSGRRATMSYDLAGHMLTTSIDAEDRTNYRYNSAGYLQAIISPNGQTLSYDYDILGRPIQVIQDGVSQEITYDSYGNITQITDQLGANTVFTYDNRQQLIAEVDAAGHITQYAYDESGNLISVDDARDDTDATIYRYDAANRLIEWVNPLGAVTQYTYDDFDNLLQITESSGLQTDFTYDLSNNVVAISQPDDREILYGRDILGRIVSQTNPLGQTTGYSYNVIGEIARITDPRGTSEAYSWYSNGTISRYALSNGIEYEYIPDALGRLTDIVDLGTEEAFAINTRIEYDDDGHIVAISQGNRTNINNNEAITHRYRYDAFGRIVRYTAPQSTIPYSYSYDAVGNLIASFNPDGIETNYSYNSTGQVIEVISGIGTARENTAIYDYDAVGNLIYADTGDGIEHRYEYDAANRLISVDDLAVDGVRHTRQFTYDEAGRLSRYQDETGLITLYNYDLFGNIVSVQQSDQLGDNPTTITSRYSYDAIDNLTQIELPDNQIINLTYNGSGQRVRYSDAANNTWSYSYDDVGNLSQISNPLGNNQNYQYDLSNRLRSITYENGGVVNFAYDALGNLASVTLPTNDAGFREVLGYEFDRSDNVIRFEQSDGAFTLNRDTFGKVIMIDTPVGDQIVFDYDESGLLTRITSIEQTVTRTYDDLGRLIRVTDGVEGFTFAYDAFGQMINFSQILIGTDDTPDEILLSIDYSYDLAGNILVRDAGELGIMRYSYDAFSRPIRIEFDDDWIEIDYNLNGWRTTIRRSNGVETRYSYDPNGRVRNLVHINADDVRLDGFAYDYDASGNLIRVTRSDNWAILYSYDAAEQLTSERWLDANNQIVYAVNYTYDLAGNRIEQITRANRDNQNRTLFEYNSRNQLVSETRNADIDIENRFSLPVAVMMLFVAPLMIVFRRRRRLMIILALVALPIVAVALQFDDADSVSYIYDANGNLTQEIFDNFGRTQYSYDAFNRLVMIEHFDANDAVDSLTHIRYDGLGRVVSIIADDTQTDFTYDALGQLAVTVDDSVESQFSPISSDTVLVRNADRAIWLLDDGLGNVQRFADVNGASLNPENGFHVNAFGEMIVPHTAISSVDDAFIEQIYLEDSGLILMGVRAYHTRIGRFLQRDWVRHDPQGNLYTFAYNNPTKFNDPTGFTPQTAFDAAALERIQIDPMDFVVEPNMPNLPNNGTVAQLQADNIQRLSTVSSALQTDYNAMAVLPSMNACDLYVQWINPPTQNAQLAYYQANGILFNQHQQLGWMSNPQAGSDAHSALLDNLHYLQPRLNRSLQGVSRWTGCSQGVMLPQVNAINPSEFYDNLAALRLHLQSGSFYATTTAQVQELLTILDDEPMMPNITIRAVQPDIFLAPSAQLNALQQATSSLFTSILLPQVSTEPFQWQSSAQAQGFLSAPIIEIER